MNIVADVGQEGKFNSVYISPNTGLITIRRGL